MQKLTGFLFCAFTLAATLGLLWVMYPNAAMSKEEYEQYKTPQDPELFEDVNIEDFGEVPVFDMMLHYIDNPPAESDNASVKIRFQGC